MFPDKSIHFSLDHYIKKMVILTTILICSESARHVRRWAYRLDPSSSKMTSPSNKSAFAIPLSDRLYSKNSYSIRGVPRVTLIERQRNKGRIEGNNPQSTVFCFSSFNNKKEKQKTR
jgi:hypothetical protein